MKLSQALRFLLLASSLLPVAASAHQLQSLSLSLEEQADQSVIATLKTSVGRDGRAVAVLPLLQPTCEQTGGVRREALEELQLTQWQLHCAGGLEGRELHIKGLGPSLPDIVVSLRFADGGQWVRVLDRQQPSLTITRQAGGVDYALGAYFPLGMMHILGGIDHLLFVLCLLLVIRAMEASWLRLLAVITAFTLAHSLTLALSMLTAVRLPSSAVEACIALSILLLAVELARYRVAPQAVAGLSLRYPALVAFMFGLLHGFGFAGALADIGLPEAARGWALLLFNLGVEAGQLLFVGAVLLLAGLANILPLHKSSRHRLAALAPAVLTTCVGAVSAYWFIDRLQPIVLGG